MIGGLKGMLGDLRNLLEQVLWCAPVVLDMQGIKIGDQLNPGVGD